MTTDRIGKYRVIGKLGQGGMARVLLTMVAGPHQFNKLMVVKELREDLAQDPEFLAMFLDEARLAARLNHPNVVQTYEVGQEGERFFIAMEYLEGQPLHTLLRRVGRNNVSIDLHVRILADALAGLHYAHSLTDFDGSSLRVVHRDVSPQNVFVTYDGQVKVVDFGIAKAAGAMASTRAGQFKGKLAYVAPEQARGAALDARADLFAIGVMLWEAMAQARLSSVEGQAALLARRVGGHDPKIREIVPESNPELADICDKAMALDADQRFETARVFQEALEEYLERLPQRPTGKEIGTLVTSAFVEERAKVRGLIDEQIRHHREAPDDAPAAIIDIVAGSPSALDPTPTFTSHPRSGGTLVASEMSSPPPPVPQRSHALMYGAGAALIVGACGVGVYLLAHPRGGSPNQGAAQASTTQVNAPASGTSVADTADKVRISISYPAGASAKLDGESLPANPFVARVPRDATIHHIEVTTDGVRDGRTITFDKDIELAFSPPVASSGTSSAAAAPIGHLGAWPSRPPPTSTPTSAPTVTPVATPEPTAPPRPTSTIDIDETDPYRKKH